MRTAIQHYYSRRRGEVVDRARWVVMEEGVKAWGNGQGPEANPYPVGTDDHRLWAHGWRLMDHQNT